MEKVSTLVEYMMINVLIMILPGEEHTLLETKVH